MYIRVTSKYAPVVSQVPWIPWFCISRFRSNNQWLGSTRNSWFYLDLRLTFRPSFESLTPLCWEEHATRRNVWNSRYLHLLRNLLSLFKVLRTSLLARLRAVSLFSVVCRAKRETRKGPRAWLMARDGRGTKKEMVFFSGYRPRFARALNRKKKRDCSQSTIGQLYAQLITAPSDVFAFARVNARSWRRN